MQDVSKMFDEELRKRLNENKAAIEVDLDWYEAVRICMGQCSPFALAVNGEDWVVTYDKVLMHEPLTYFEFAAANNSIEQCSFRDVRNELSFKGYQDALRKAAANAVLWNEHVAVIKEEVIEGIISKQPKQQQGSVVRSIGQA